MNRLLEMKTAAPHTPDHLKAFADMLDAAALDYAQRFAHMATLPLQVAYDRLAGEFIKRLHTRTPQHLLEHDGRAAAWRVRVRLYDLAKSQDDPEADSDTDTAADYPGDMVLRGLPAVADYLAELAQAFHGGPCAGMDAETMAHRLKSLRPTLSRRGGNARWRVPYSPPTNGEWLAVVNIAREAKARETE